MNPHTAHDILNPTATVDTQIEGQHEMITLYSKESPENPVPCKRIEYYDNDLTTYKEHHPAMIDLFLFNKHGEILLQKRGRNKRRGPGKLHTTVGGHISWGEKPEFAVIHECLEELGAPAMVFSSDEYAEALAKLGSYTYKTAILCDMGSFFRNHCDDPIESRREIKDRVWFYFGRYDGPLEMPDRESAGYEWIDLATLEQELKTNPEQFTEVLTLYIENFGDDMKQFIQTYSGKT